MGDIEWESGMRTMLGPMVDKSEAEGKITDLLAQRDALLEVVEFFLIISDEPNSFSRYLDDCIRKAEEVRARVRGEACDHDWVDARNEAITSGQWCRKCNAVQGRSSDEPPLSAPHGCSAYDTKESSDE